MEEVGHSSHSKTAVMVSDMADSNQQPSNARRARNAMEPCNNAIDE